MILKSYLQGNPQTTTSSNAPVSEREREAVRRLTEELALNLGHQWRRPKTTGAMARYVTIAVLVLAAGGIWWYVLDGEPGHPPPAIENLQGSLHPKSPASATDQGNPGARVWEDIRTALYYSLGRMVSGNRREDASPCSMMRGSTTFHPPPANPASDQLATPRRSSRHRGRCGWCQQDQALLGRVRRKGFMRSDLASVRVL
jgi:hypothetical protein